MGADNIIIAEIMNINESIFLAHSFLKKIKHSSVIKNINNFSLILPFV